MASPELQAVRCGKIRLRVASSGPGKGPLVILAHGWPDYWYSWRYLITPLAEAGFRVLAPDMRGFGGSDAPPEIADYAMPRLVSDMVGLVDAAGRRSATIVGHDWGASVAWHCALLAPERFHAVAALSVPHYGVSDKAPLTMLKEQSGDHFNYLLYHQQPGIAEAEYEADPECLFRMLYCAPDTPREPPAISDPDRHAGGWIGRWGKPREWTDWFGPEDLARHVAVYRASGFHGGLNWYRNIDANWRYMRSRSQTVHQPAWFMVGSRDLTVAGKTRDVVEGRMRRVMPDLREFHWLEGRGHWIQKEAASHCIEALLPFLEEVNEYKQKDISVL